MTSYMTAAFETQHLVILMYTSDPKH